MELPSELSGQQFLGERSQWVALAATLRAAGTFGLDSEFYGLDVRKQSCVGLARIHIWSVAIRTERLHPRGFHRAVGWVLPAEALECSELVAVLEDESIVKAVHNQPVDDHAFHNHGIKLRGCINTLGYARWKWPWLVSSVGFGLKALMKEKLSRSPICEFLDVVSYEREIEIVTDKIRKVKRCACGVVGCRARRLPEHAKCEANEPYQTQRTKKEKGQYPLESIVIGHERWELLVRYSAEDAIAGVEVLELIELEEDPAPFPFGSVRPMFSQAVEDSIVAMERVGFRVDVEWCRTQADRALKDEETELVWLHKWSVLNAPVEGPHRRDEVDGVWSSPTQLVALFDLLEWPRSPVWKKGRVKRGEVKTDATALEWIGKNAEGSAPLIKHLLHLKRIRSGKKYLVKLRDSGGMVYPICGPAGDDDDRNGAVTGRLGIKGTLEAQQLPTNEELDLYQVRRAIIA